MINRLLDKECIKQIYEERKGKGTMLILHGPTGVGKTYLVDNIFSEDISAPYLRVRINKQEAQESQGSYISGLARAFDNHAKSKGEFPTLLEFVRFVRETFPDKEKNLNDIIDLALELEEFKEIKAVRKKFKERKELKENQVNRILNASNDANRSIILEYISHVAFQTKIIVVIENMQYASDMLIAFINELISKGVNLFFIGEYTTSNYDVSELLNRLDASNTEVVRIKGIDKEELVNAAKDRLPKNSVDAICCIIKNTYNETSGNLAHLNQLFKENYRSWKLDKDQSLSSIKYDNTINYSYRALSNNKKMLLWYIITHHGSVPRSLLACLLQSSLDFPDEITEAIQLLQEQDFIKYVSIEDKFILYHDSLFDLLKEEEGALKYILLANRDWLEFYKKISLSEFEYSSIGVSRYDSLLMQISFIVSSGNTSNSDWLNIILDEIGNSLNKEHSDSIVSRIKSIFYFIRLNKDNELIIKETYEKVVKILYRLGYFYQICELRKLFYPQDSSDLLKLMVFSARVSTCDKSVESELQKITDDNGVFLFVGCQLLLIKYYRIFSKLYKSKTLWIKLITNVDVKNPYYPTILSYANVCSFNVFKRIKYLTLAQEKFLQVEDKRSLCASLLNINANLHTKYLLKLISKNTYLTSASLNYNRVREILPEIYYPLNELENNKMVLQLTEGLYPLSNIMDGFYRAYSMCNVAGNKSVIISNFLAVGLMTGKEASLAPYVNELMQYIRIYNEMDSEFAKYPLLNCYNYYFKLGNKSGRKKVMYYFKRGSGIGFGSEYMLLLPFLFESIFLIKKYHIGCVMNWDVDFEFLNNQFK